MNQNKVQLPKEEVDIREIEVINDLLDQLPPELKQRMTKRANAEIDGVKVYDIQFDEDGKVSGRGLCLISFSK